MNNKVLISHKNQRERGQALITMVFFIVIAVSILSASALILAGSMQSTSVSEQGLLTYSAAESGAEDGILHVLRKPDYADPFTYTIDGVQVSVTFTLNAATQQTTIASTATLGASSRTIQVQTSRVNGALTITSWKEI